ncbi:hypothetical protein Acor_30400 [Acrocarpospora corrugata]|uniref:Uncharacterized protein n=1 Tax=Acrocarpospora corrugata TaxID=35763 RepID=A0A5M3VWV3_9ACTN|nr:hypothetical protein [Acrocarpospora corrugata]GES00976.1 hypothetical protein Acor_30400 [Acrocarpospora corrugata]
MNAGEREELARLLPYQPELPGDRCRQLKEFVMSEIKPAKRKRRLPRPAVLAPVLAAAAAVAITLPLLSGGAAYAVTKKADGTIHITIDEAKNPEGLEADLRGMGLNAVVDYIPMGKKCSPQPRSESFLSEEEAPLTLWPVPEEGQVGFTIDPRVVKDGQTAVLEFSVSDTPGATVAGIWARVSTGPVAACRLVDSTGAPLGPSGG